MLNIVATSGRMGGRKPGSPNKINADIRAMVLEALQDVGGTRYLARQAIENPGPFMTLLGKILPTTVANADGSPVALHLIAAQLVSQQILEMQAQMPGHTVVDTTPAEQRSLLDQPPPSE